MKKMELFMEKYLLPVSIKIGNNLTMQAIRDGLSATLPLIIIGALFLLIGNLPIPNYENFLVKILGKNADKILSYPVKVTYDLIALYSVFAITHARVGYAKIKSGINGGFVALASFIIIVPFEKTVSNVNIENILPTDFLGSQGLFTAILVSLIVSFIYIKIIKKGLIIKMPKEVPSAVSNSFTSLLPILICITLFLIIKIGFTYTSYETFNDFIMKTLQTPFTHLTGTLWGAIIINLFVSILWIFGLHGGAIVGSVVFAPLSALAIENKDAFVAHANHLPHIVTQQFLDNFTYLGGGGSTILLLLCLLIMKKTKGLESQRSIAKMSFIPALFNINEPVIFGLPIVYNFILAIPFILGPVVMTLITYFAMKLNLVSSPVGTAVPWTAPPLISGFLATFDFKAIILQIILIVIPMGIYYPFIKLLAKTNLNKIKQGEHNEK